MQPFFSTLTNIDHCNYVNRHELNQCLFEQLTQSSEHENSGYPEGEGVAFVVEGALVAGVAVQVGPHQGHDKHRDQAPRVDGKVEDGEKLLPLHSLNVKSLSVN